MAAQRLSSTRQSRVQNSGTKSPLKSTQPPREFGPSHSSFHSRTPLPQNGGLVPGGGFVGNGCGGGGGGMKVGIVTGSGKPTGCGRTGGGCDESEAMQRPPRQASPSSQSRREVHEHPDSPAAHCTATTSVFSLPVNSVREQPPSVSPAHSKPKPTQIRSIVFPMFRARSREWGACTHPPRPTITLLLATGCRPGRIQSTGRPSRPGGPSATAPR